MYGSRVYEKDLGYKYGYGKYQQVAINGIKEDKIIQGECRIGKENKPSLSLNGSLFLTSSVMWVMCQSASHHTHATVLIHNSMCITAHFFFLKTPIH